MALHHDLLEQARHLAQREPKRPRQASLRRAVSAAYYALFHLLVGEGARMLAPQRAAPLRHQMQRAYSHGDMKAVCQQFGRGQTAPTTQALISQPLETQIMSVARTFVALQEERHSADYDIAASFIRVDVLAKINRVERAFVDWGNVRNSENARVFLAALLLQKHWNK